MRRFRRGTNDHHAIQTAMAALARLTIEGSDETFHQDRYMIQVDILMNDLIPSNLDIAGHGPQGSGQVDDRHARQSTKLRSRDFT